MVTVVLTVVAYLITVYVTVPGVVKHGAPSVLDMFGKKPREWLYPVGLVVTKMGICSLC